MSLTPRIVCFSFVWIAVQCAELNYDVVLSSGKHCPGRDSCQKTQDRSQRGPIEEKNWKKRNCFCDTDCRKYGDCCADAKVEEDRKSWKDLSCLNFKQYGHVYLKSHCPPDENIPEDIKQACEAADEFDPIGNTPVTSLTTGFTYKNYFCANCHNDLESVKFWKSRLECPTITGYSERFRNISKDYVAERLEIRGGQWGIEIDTGGVGVFHRCQVDPALPDELSHYIRPCPGENIVNKCPSEYQNDTVKDLCLSYTGIVHFGEVKYKNSYCAICNDKSPEKLICLTLGPLGRFHWQKNFNTFSFAVLFDISGSGVVGKKCEISSQVYDPFFKKCRNVICGQNDSSYIDGKCVRNDEITTTTDQVIIATTTATTTILTTETTAREPMTTTPLFLELLPESILNDNKTEELPSKNQSRPTKKTTTSTSTTTSSTTTTTTKSSSSTSVTFLISQNISRFENDAEIFSECPKILLSTGEFKSLGNGSVFVPKYGKIFDKDQFEETKDSILICIPKDGDRYSEEYYSEASEMKFGSYMAYISLACLGISVVCLTLHLFASLIAPELQNLSGKNLFSLSCSLLGGYTSFIAGMFVPNDGSGCWLLALIMYVFFLASFVWMFIISFDVCKSLRLATSKLRLMAGVQWKRFGIYSLLGWSIPIIFGVLTAFADLYENDVLIRPGFGEAGLCWFSSKKALLLYFALPFGLIVTGNLGFFIWSAFLVYDNTKEGPQRRGSCSNVNYHLYLRLGILMGLTWIVGLIAGFLDFEVLWILFIVLNTLQGLFIFLAFTCTKKVLKSLKTSWTSTTDSIISMSTSGTTTGMSSNYESSSSTSGKTSGFGGKTMYMVTPPNTDSLPTHNSFNKRYY